MDFDGRSSPSESESLVRPGSPSSSESMLSDMALAGVDWLLGRRLATADAEAWARPLAVRDQDWPSETGVAADDRFKVCSTASDVGDLSTK